MNRISEPSQRVMPSLEPGIRAAMDCRVKPVNGGLAATVALIER
jgi:hypothetical protein